MNALKSAALAMTVAALAAGGFATTASAQMAKMSAKDSKMMDSCMAMAPDAMKKSSSCMSMMKKSGMTDADMQKMMACKGMSKDAMMADKDCMAMGKMHPGMMMMK